MIGRHVSPCKERKAAKKLNNLAFDYLQVAKEQMAMQVVDTTNVTRIYSSRDLAALFRLEASTPAQHPDSGLTEDENSVFKSSLRVRQVINEDNVLSTVLQGQSKIWITKIGRHQDAVEKNPEEDLSRSKFRQSLEQFDSSLLCS